MSAAQIAVAAGSALNEAIGFYNAGQYVRALAALDSAIARDKAGALAHYYRANTLLYLSQTDDAMEEYKLAYGLAPAHSQMARYCMDALRSYDQKQTDEDRQAVNRQLVRQMVTQIQLELARHKQRLQSGAQAEASHHSKLADTEQERISEQAAREMEYLANNPIPVACGARLIMVPRFEEMFAVKQKADNDCRLARQQADRRAKEAMDAATGSALELEKSATNLESQFLKPAGKGVRLSVLGTNLYVRNYVTGSDPGDEDLPVPLVAKAKRLKWPGH